MGKNFKGFPPDAFTLLELNKFNDSKPFYESVKEEIKAKATTPMRQLCMDLYEELYAVDDKMNLIPTKMVSRVRRDTRFSNNKAMYRSNMWCMFMRDKHSWRVMPCMWFEYYPESYNYGVGFFRVEPSDLEVFRQVLSENQKEFKYALRQMEIVGAHLVIDCFKKEKAGTDKIEESLKQFYNAKSFFFIYEDYDMSKLIDGSIEEELRYAIRAYAPMYKFLLKVTDKIYEKGD